MNWHQFAFLLQSHCEILKGTYTENLSDSSTFIVLLVQNARFSLEIAMFSKCLKSLREPFYANRQNNGLMRFVALLVSVQWFKVGEMICFLWSEPYCNRGLRLTSITHLVWRRLRTLLGTCYVTTENSTKSRIYYEKTGIFDFSVNTQNSTEVVLRSVWAPVMED